MIVPPDADTIPAAIGAIKGALGGSDEQLLPTQIATLRALAAVFHAPNIDPATTPALEPHSAAEAIVDEQQRHQLIQTMVVLTFMEHPPNEDDQHAIRRYAHAFHVHEDAVGILIDYVHGHTKRMILDTFRSMPMAQWEHAFAKDEGYATVAHSLLATFDKGESPKLAAKFHNLEQCPPASLGRKVWEMYHANGWPFPGERHGVPEATTVHDWVHILSGYPPTPLGEIQVTAFIAACCPDPKLFGAVVLALGLYEAGAFRLPQFPEAPSGGVLETPNAPEALADAIRRGLATNTDVMEGIDHWVVANESVADLRARYGIVAKEEPTPGADPGV